MAVRVLTLGLARHTPGPYGVITRVPCTISCVRTSVPAPADADGSLVPQIADEEDTVVDADVDVDEDIVSNIAAVSPTLLARSLDVLACA